MLVELYIKIEIFNKKLNAYFAESGIKSLVILVPNLISETR